MSDAPIAGDEVLRELERILASRAFQGAGRSGALLRFLLERTLAGQADQLKDTPSGPRRSAVASRSTREPTRSSASKSRACEAA